MLMCDVLMVTTGPLMKLILGKTICRVVNLMNQPGTSQAVPCFVS